VVVVLDPGLLRIVNVTSGLKAGGIVIVNTTKSPQQIREEFNIQATVATVGATKIALELLGVPITNTTMIGAVIKATEAVKLESLMAPIKNRFGRLADKNIDAMKRAYTDTVIEELTVDTINR
jgi:pyruvate ferredoxin oxidoreductase gamma subunit